MKTPINTAIVVFDIRKMPLRHLSNDAMMNVQGTISWCKNGIISTMFFFFLPYNAIRKFCGRG